MMPTIVGRAAKRLWRLIVLRDALYRDSHSRLGALYWLPDPWGMRTAPELFRFERTNLLIQQHFGRVKRLLEIGCGEGHQSEYLLDVCGALYGIDVSRLAVKRARNRCPTGIFEIGDIFSSAVIRDFAPFDLVVACEVLYYVRDIPSILKRMSEIGTACLVTYYEKSDRNLAPLFLQIEQGQKADFRFESKRWQAVWWQKQPFA